MLTAPTPHLPPPPPPRELTSGFYVTMDGFPDSILPFRVMLTNEMGGENPDIPYATILVENHEGDVFPPIRLTFSQYTNNFLNALNPAINSGRPHRLELDNDIEIDGMWWTGTRDEVVRNAGNYIRAQLREQGSGADLGGKRHYRKSHKKRSGHKRSGHKRSGHKKRKSGKRSHRRRH